MSYQLCPKCSGQGIVSKPPWVAGDVNTWTSTQTTYVCDVCNGAKILLVNDKPTLRGTSCVFHIDDEWEDYTDIKKPLKSD